MTPRPSLPLGASQWLLPALGLAWLVNLALLITMLVMLQQQRAELRELFRRDAAEKTSSTP
jgi:hypothetical protein